jgi:hypothetical protein
MEKSASVKLSKSEELLSRIQLPEDDNSASVTSDEDPTESSQSTSFVDLILSSPKKPLLEEPSSPRATEQHRLHFHTQKTLQKPVQVTINEESTHEEKKLKTLIQKLRQDYQLLEKKKNEEIGKLLLN